MKNFLIKFVNLIFYSNIWIALCALALALQTQLLLKGNLELSPIIGLIFFATWFLYAIHRIVALQKVSPFKNEGRYLVISTFKSHIIIYAGIAALGGAYCFFLVSRVVQFSLVIPAIISLGYVFPIVKGNLRLRDFHHVKIFLIAIVWTWVTVVLPALEWGALNETSIWLMALERAIFIFAITLPFDIRDIKIDEHINVKTIPAVIGARKAKFLAYFCLMVMMVFVYINTNLGFYSLNNQWALFISAISTSIFIRFSDKIEHDYFFTGLMDGTMIIQFLLVWQLN